MEDFIASDDFEPYLQHAALAGANGNESCVEILGSANEDGKRWSFKEARDNTWRPFDIPLSIYWSVKPKDPREKLRNDLKVQLANLTKYISPE